MKEKLIVIGGTAAGLSAASKARRLKPDLDIKVFEKSGYVSYGACGLPYYVSDIIKDAGDLIAMSAAELTEKRAIATYTHHEVTMIDRAGKRVKVVDLQTGKEYEYPYDSLVIATGAAPVRPDIPGIGAGGVFYLRTVEDGIRLKEQVTRLRQITDSERNPAGHSATGNAAIIGGGFIGLEMAEAFTQSGLTVHLYETAPRLLPFLDPGLSALVQETLVNHGIKLHLGAEVSEFETDHGNVRAVKTIAGDSQRIDFALISTGVIPASELAREAGLALGIKGAVKVDATMRTSDPHIWACGDCAETINRITGRPAYVPLGTTANKQGRVAGENLAGGKAVFPGILGSMVTKLFETTIAATGLTAEQAQQAGFAPTISTITKGDRASYYPGGTDNTICLIADRATGRLLGAQGIGGDTVAGRINLFAAAITAQMSVSQISELDLVYAPPIAPVYDPVLIAAAQAAKKTERQ